MHLGIEIAGHGGYKRTHVQGTGGGGGEAADVMGDDRGHAVSVDGGEGCWRRSGHFDDSGKYRAG